MMTAHSGDNDGYIYFEFPHGENYKSRTLGIPPERVSITYFGSLVTFQLSPDGLGETYFSLTNKI